MQRPISLLALAAVAFTPLSRTVAHESFLLWHEHSHAGAGAEHADHAGHGHGKEEVHLHEHSDPRWKIGTGVRYTRLSLHGERAELWETGIGIAYRATPWLELGVEASYGWFDSKEGDSGGSMVPHFHADVHLPLDSHLELVIGGEAGFPGGDEGLVGDHWEIAPHLAIRYDTGRWFAEAGVSYAFLPGASHNHEHDDEPSHEEGEAHEEHEAHGEHEAKYHAPEEHGEEHRGGDFHEIVDPHGEQEFQYYLAAGMRLLDERLTVEGRLSGIHVTRGETPDRDYLRAGLRTTWTVNENWRIRTEASVPITDARRNHFQGSLSLQVSF